MECVISVNNKYLEEQYHEEVYFDSWNPGSGRLRKQGY
jgi:hypothetical protein